MTVWSEDSVEEFLGSKYAIAVLLYIRGHPGRCKTDVMRAVGNEKTVYARIGEGIRLGLIRMDTGGIVHNKTLLTLTDRGQHTAVLLGRILEETVPVRIGCFSEKPIETAYTQED